MSIRGDDGAGDAYDVDWAWRSGKELYRYVCESDLEPIAAMLSDPEVGRWLWFTPMTKQDAIQYFRPIIERQQQHLERGELPDALCFSVDEDSSRNFIGQGAILAVPGSDSGFEIGFQLTKQASGRGVGSRLSRFLLRFAMERLNAYRIEGACLEGNLASAALLRNLGLRLEGTLVDYRLRDQVRHTELRFGARVQDLEMPPVHGDETRLTK